MKLRVLQWNAWDKEKAENIVALIRSVDADLVCLQELTQTSPANPEVDIPAMIAALGYEPLYQITTTRGGPKFARTGLGIFSKWPIIDRRYEPIQKEDTTKVPPRYDRGYLEATVLTSEGRVTLGTSHLSFSYDFQKMTDARRKEADALLRAIGKPKGNYIFGGDLNATPNSYIITELQKMLVPCDPDFANTWTTKPFSYHGFEADTLDWCIDYMFATPDMKIVHNEIVKTEASDHLPILTVFEL